MRILFIILLIALTPHSANAQSNILCSELEKKEIYEGNKPFRYLVEGPEGWTFRSKIDLKQDYKLSEERLNDFKRLAEKLAGKGVKLHLAMQPARGITHPTKIPYDHERVEFEAGSSLESYKESIRQLQAAGISVTDFTDFEPTEDTRFYFKRDHHWRPAGAKLSAQKLAESIRKHTPNYQSTKTYTTEVSGETVWEGSFDKFIKKKCDKDVPGEELTLYKTFESAEGEDALFGDSVSAEFVLTGTSNSAEPYAAFANFAGFLREELSADVDNVSIVGGGIESAIISYLNSEDYAVGQHKNLIWEVSSHYNFNGKKIGDVFRQVIPATQGFCEGNELFKTTYEFGDSKKPIFDGSLMENPPSISGLDRYMTLKFSDKVQQDFLVMIEYDNDTTDRFRFWRADKYPHDGIYFLSLDRQDDAKIKSIKILTDEGFVAYDVNLQICSY